MSEPSKKSPALTSFLESVFGRTTAIKGNVCVGCRKPVVGFRNERSKNEYRISGLCQACQDSVFGKD